MYAPQPDSRHISHARTRITNLFFFCSSGPFAQTLLREWRDVFYLTSGFYLLGMILFALYGSAELQSWNAPPQEPKDIEADLKATKTVENILKVGAFLLINAIVLLLVTYI